MATKKKARKNASSSNGNGNVNLARLKDEERVTEIHKRYPEVVEPLTALASAIEMVSPIDARTVSGYLRSRVAAFTEERRGEIASFRRQQKLDRLAAKEGKYKAALAELAELREEINA